MRKTKLKVEDHTEYAILRGGKAIVLYADTKDMVTDVDRPAMSVEVSSGTQKGQTIEFVPRGGNNNAPLEVMKRVMENVTVGACVEFNTKVAYGDAVMVLRMTRDETTDEIKYKQLLPSEEPEIFSWIEDNEYDRIAEEIANDLVCFYDSYIEYVFNQEEVPRLVQVNVKEASHTRISKIDPDKGYSLWHGYSALWHKGQASDDISVLPLLRSSKPLLDLKTRMGKIPGTEGLVKIVKDRRFVENIKLSTPGRFYYSRPYWWSIFTSGWYDFSCSIPKVKAALIKNQMVLRYTVFIRKSFFGDLYASNNITDPEKQKDFKQKFMNNLDAFLSGEENAGKSFVTMFDYDRMKGVEEKDIIINPLESFIKGGEYIEDSEETSNMISFAMGVHPSVIGASPGKNQSISGSEARELFNVHQALSKSIQKKCLLPLYRAKVMNGWPQDIYFSIANLQLTTLDKGTGATKNIGVPLDTSKK